MDFMIDWFMAMHLLLGCIISGVPGVSVGIGSFNIQPSHTQAPSSSRTIAWLFLRLQGWNVWLPSWQLRLLQALPELCRLNGQETLSSPPQAVGSEPTSPWFCTPPPGLSTLPASSHAPPPPEPESESESESFISKNRNLFWWKNMADLDGHIKKPNNKYHIKDKQINSKK